VLHFFFSARRLSPSSIKIPILLGPSSLPSFSGNSIQDPSPSSELTVRPDFFMESPVVLYKTQALPLLPIGQVPATTASVLQMIASCPGCRSRPLFFPPPPILRGVKHSKRSPPPSFPVPRRACSSRTNILLLFFNFPRLFIVQFPRAPRSFPPCHGKQEDRSHPAFFSHGRPFSPWGQTGQLPTPPFRAFNVCPPTQFLAPSKVRAVHTFLTRGQATSSPKVSPTWFPPPPAPVSFLSRTSYRTLIVPVVGPRAFFPV